jgi:hypothetical protein
MTTTTRRSSGWPFAVSGATGSVSPSRVLGLDGLISDLGGPGLDRRLIRGTGAARSDIGGPACVSCLSCTITLRGIACGTCLWLSLKELAKRGRKPCLRAAVRR